MLQLQDHQGGRDADRSRDLALTSIIGYGLRHGAGSAGAAVRIAYKAHRKKGATRTASTR